jgi:hypothetical protein
MSRRLVEGYSASANFLDDLFGTLGPDKRLGVGVVVADVVVDG